MSQHYSSTRKSNITPKRLLLILALIVGCLPAMGQAVIMNGDYFLTHNEAGTSVNTTATTSFNPATCLWAYARRDYIRTANSSGEAINNNNNYLQNSTTVSLGTDWGDFYRGDNNENIRYRAGYYNTSYYLRLNGTTWQFSTTNSYNGALYDVTITPQAVTSTNPTISGADVLTAAGNTTYTASGASYRAAYTNYDFRSANHYFDANGNSFTGTPANANITYSWSLTDNAYATVNNSGVVTVSRLPEYDITLTLTVTATATGGTPAAPANTTLTATKEIIIQGTKPSAPTISVSGTSVTLSTTAVGTTSIRYTLDGTNPTASTGTVYSGAIDLSSSTTSPVIIKAVTVRNGNASDVSTETVTLTLPTPVITVNGSAGTATIACDITGTTIYYTTNGSEPTTSSSQYSGSLSGLSPMTTIKAIAVKTGWNNSPVASETVTIPSGVSGSTVTVFDYEDHNWSYYQASGNLPTGYPTEYLSSPNPRNVKITYRGINATDSKPHLSNGNAINNATAVAISALDTEGQNEMIYYKTLEKSVPGMSGDYPYTVISNPFSKRPSTGSGNSKVYYGFAGWKVVDGGEYISEYGDNDVLPLDAPIHFTGLDDGYTPNCTSAEVVFEATWAAANVQTGNSAPTFSGGTYETNFWVLQRNQNIGDITVPANVTVSARYPDGTVNFNYNLTGAITAGGNNAKVEFVNMNSTSAVTASNYTFTMGRGIVNSNNGGQLSASNRDANSNNTVKVESGTYASFYNFTNGLSSARTCDQLVILGCDYDRAKNDNTKMIVRGNMYVGSSIQLNRAANSLYTRTYIKSGNFGSTVTVEGNNNYTGSGGDQTYYYSVANTQNAGRRYLCVEGGRLDGIAGGMDETNNQTVTARAFDLRVRGTAQVDGVVYGAAEYANARGTRTMIFTGGTINGWVAGGANGTQSTNGALTGATYLYVGGNTTVNSNSSTQVLNRAVGGNVFGAGCGNSASSSSGQILTYNTNVVVADDATVERGVYGGGSYGYTTNTANIFVLGGTVNGANGGVNGTTYQASITGGVFGGACQNQGGTVNIYMDGGLVNGGVYGGSNVTGTISGSVTMNINGGQVGTSSSPANIHGGGYGQPTRVSQNVEITLGSSCTATEGVTVYGDVYGGSALGYVNGTAANNTYHTYVTLNKGTIYGSLYGGGLGNAGNAANVYGPVQVKVFGGSVKKTDANGANGSGAVYGCNNISGAPQRAVTVDIYGTDPQPSEDEYALFAVYGGGNQASYSYGTPTVTVHNCDNSIEYVYGGGNAAHITNGNTDVTIYGGNKIGNVFGGGNGTVTAANVSGNTDVKIYGGTIGRVFGGSNSQGTIGGTISVTAETQTETGNDPCSGNAYQSCPIQVGALYGGGNMAASNVGNISIGCMTTNDMIDTVYCGANQADITGSVDFSMTGGRIGNLFGGNNKTGNISGTIKLEVNWDNTCSDNYLGNVFGGGNLATYGTGTNYPVVNILNGTVSGNVYGGGKGKLVDGAQHGQAGKVTGNPQVTIGDNVTGHTATVLGEVYGGGDAADVAGIPVIVVNDCNTEIGYLYGGGNAADVNGTNITFHAGTVHHDAFGGGHGDKDASNPSKYADVNGNVVFNVYGGTIDRVFAGSNSKGNITGSSTLTINKTGTCAMKIHEVYGGGNEAAGNAGTINITCTGALTTQASNPDQIGTTLEGIGAVYGGANQANIGTSEQSSNITLNINSGMVGNVYGGNNTSGTIYGDIQVNINKNSDACGWYVGDVFGGGNKADYSGTPDVNIQAGTVSGSVFGGGNAASVGGSDVAVSGGQVNGGVYGGCNASGNTGAVTIALTGGQVGTSGTSADVFGGGFGSATTTSGNITVTFGNGTTSSVVYGDIYGGSAFGSVNSASANPANTTTLTINGSTLHGTIYGGGKGSNEGSGTTATSNGNVVVNYNTTNANLTGLYGGANINGNVKGDITLNVLADVGASGSGNSINVFGGGLGHATNTEGNVTVNVGTADGSKAPTVYGDIYGGSALGNVNNAVADLTTINILNGTVHGNVYGGGLGDATLLANGYLNTSEPTIEAIVNGTVHVNIGHATVNTSAPTIDGKVFGCNNLAGTPKGPVYVDIYRTAHSGDNFYPNPEPSGANNIPTPTAANFAISEVYGGGNLAHYTTTEAGASTHVHIHDCYNTIQYVYGGGNAANTVANEVTIDGGRFEYVFGGGNGKGTGNPGANVDNDAIVNVNGGIINYVFGGSNTLGVVNGTASMTFANPATCTRLVKELYGGGNMAPGGTVALTIPCGVDGLNVVFGGSRNADIGTEALFNGGTKKNVTLTIEGGTLAQVFGGNNQGGTIWGDVTLNLKGGTIGDAFGGNNAGGNVKGVITVNVEDAENTTCPLALTNVFGGGKDAAYTPADATISGPLVNIKHKKSGTSITGSVFGGGQGSTATVTANPVVTVGDLTDANHIATIGGDVYGGGDAANVVGTTTVLVQKCNTVINGDVYGGGNAANVNGTSVTVTGGIINGSGHGMVFGGGHGDNDSSNPKVANVNGNVAVAINGGTINKVFAGSNLNGTITGTTSVNVNKTGDCAMKVGELYGGGNVAAGNAGTITVGCTGTWTTTGEHNHTNHNSTDNRIGYELEGIGTVYGGANAANIGASGTGNESNITLNINSGMVDNVFGGNNTSGDIYGTIQVNINKNAETCSWYVGNVFGGGNHAAYAGSPAVTLTNGTVSHNIYGGGNEAGVGGSTVNINGGQVAEGVYGGCNSSGTVTGNIAVNLTSGTIGATNGTTNIVFGGGYGASTATEGNVTVTVNGSTIHGHVYGGSALGSVNNEGTDLTTVHVLAGTVNGNIYGGGLGEAGAPNVAKGQVNGTVTVNIGAAAVAPATNPTGSATINGSVYGCNNTNGSPKANVNVNVYKTAHTAKDLATYTGDDATYAIYQVFGGGNQADYTPTSTDSRATVHVYTCDNTIERVFGGGNAAAAYGVVTVLDGGRYDYVFGGGNGEVTAANIGNGGTDLTVHGGRINLLFGGSNAQGTITGPMSVNVDAVGDCGNDMYIAEFFCGNNLANIGTQSNPTNIVATIGCGTTFGDVYGGCNLADIYGNVTLTVEGSTMNNVYGGSKGDLASLPGTGHTDKAANINGNVTLNITGGEIGNAFGGSNINGNITGSIEVNVEKAANPCVWSLSNVYGASNMAAYTPTTPGSYPAVKIKNGNVTHNVFGGGLGATATVTSNPVVTIGDNTSGYESYVATVGGDVYGGGDAGNVVGTPQVNVLNKCNTTIANVYGGGNAADVSGTDVNIDGGTITGMVFGGGHGDKTSSPQKEANVYGDVAVDVTGGTISKVFGGSNSKGNITGDVTVNIEKGATSCDMHITEVYGGGNEAAGNAGTITIGCTGDYETNGEGITNVYGGANAANVGNSINLTIKGGHIDNVYGGNNTSGSISGSVTVNVNWDDALTCGKYLGNVFGGGNLAALDGAATVNIQKGTVSHNVYGGGNQAGVGSATVNMTGGNVLEGLYGGCNSSGDAGRVVISLTGGQVGTSGTSADVFGGGLGAATTTSNNINVTLDGTTVYGDIYGGSALGSVNASTTNGDTITISTNTLHGTIYGGGKGSNEGTGTTAVTNGNVVINYNTANTGLAGLYGGANVNGNVKGDITVNVLANVGSSSTNINVFGGGLGHATDTEGNVTVNVGTATTADVPVIYGDIYGGSALGNVNNAVADLTTINILNGTVHGNVYGGGLGDATLLANGYLNTSEPTIEAIVYGTVHVNIGHATVNTSAPTIDGKVFGCNNLAGTPKGPVYVDIYRTAHSGDNFYPNPEPSGANNIPTPTAANFAISEVYGGGNLAHYETDLSGASTHVHIHNCDNTIQYVYGGGNAANTVANEVTIDGGRFEYVFGGGNGKGDGNPGANVDNDAIVNVDGGIINYVFGGSNTLGVVNGTSSMTFATTPTCTRMVKELYGGGNEAPGGSVVLTIPCGVTGLNVVYGGSKNADIGSETLFNGGTKKNVVLTIEGGVLDKIFGGNNQGGTIWGDVTLNLKGGTIVDAFGGNNAGGNIKGTITVNVEDAESETCPLVLTNVFGGGKDAAYTPADATISGPLVNIKHKKSGTSITGSVFGGGQGSTAVVTANPVVTIGDANASHLATISGNVYGGGDAAAVTGNTTVTYNDNNTSSSVSNLFGGGNQAGISGTATVTLTSGKVTSGIYGGCNTSGTVGGAINVYVNGGTIGSSSTRADGVFGGGFGQSTETGSDVTVTIGNSDATPIIYGDVYGGSAKGKVNSSSASPLNTTKVWLKKGTITGDIYGGGYGLDNVEALVYGNVQVIVDGGTVNSYTVGTDTYGGRVFGCNNVNGTPKGTVEVTVNATNASSGSGNTKVYALQGVYGGGNLAGYVPTATSADYPIVTVNGCASSIKDVYGGGNAAPVPNTKVVINGGDIKRVFAGGNGESGTPAHIGWNNTNGTPTTGNYGTGIASAEIKGGTIEQVFGGSNANGVIRVSSSVNVDKSTASGACTMKINEVYGGGNMAAGNAGTVTIGCTGTLVNLSSGQHYGVDAEGITYVYGGANQAGINNDIVLSINSGIVENVFGGNNTSGAIAGSIQVNINKDNSASCASNWYVGNVYGGGNLAKYTAPTTGSYTGKYPVVNILNGLVSGDVFGGGLGSSGTAGQVTGNPQVTVNGANAQVDGGVYGGGSLAPTEGNPLVTLTTGALTNVYGGGKAASIIGAPTVNINGGTVSTGVYGGCDSQGNVSGDIIVNITGDATSQTTIGTDATHRANIHGGGYGESTETTGNVTVNFGTLAYDNTSGTPVEIHSEFPKLYGDVYGGSALGEVNGGPTNKTTVNILNGELITNQTTSSNGFPVYNGGNVFGGGLGRKATSGVTAAEAKVYGTVTVNIGGPHSRTLNPDDDTNVGRAIIQGNVYGCNNTNGSPQDSVVVNIYRTNRTADDELYGTTYALHNVFGGGNEADYIPATTAMNKKLKVYVHNCYNTIERVFGGSNAAAAGAVGNTVTVHTLIEGGRFNNVFGGGNGEVSAANIKGDVKLEIHGGIVNEFFVGSNQNGTITGNSNVIVDEASHCESVLITEFFCGGKYADVEGNIEASINCSDALTVTNLYGGCKEADVTAGNGQPGNVHLSVYGGHYTNVFGGSKGDLASLGSGHSNNSADIAGNVVLDLYGGTMENVYGGSNVNGNISGTITVNVIDAESTTCPLYITNIYGGSNLTSYTPTNGANLTSPVVNVVHIKSGISGNVYGASKGVVGTAATVTANPQVNIGYDASQMSSLATYLSSVNYSVPEAPRAIISGSVFGGGDAATVIGNTEVFLRKKAKVFGNVYGGGNMGEVTGNTKVIVNGQNN